jgi:hypothetical protein
MYIRPAAFASPELLSLKLLEVAASLAPDFGRGRP